MKNWRIYAEYGAVLGWEDVFVDDEPSYVVRVKGEVELDE